MINSFILFLRFIYHQRTLILSMVVRRLKTQHIATLLGFIWTFITPLVLMGIFWFVFSVGFKVKPVENIPFIVWLMAGMSIWFFFSDVLNQSVGVVVEHGMLIKKTIFPSQVLPLITILSNLVTHCVFLLLLSVLVFIYNMDFGFYDLQIMYYLFCTIVLLLGLGWALSALNVFARDVGQLVAVVLQVGFWVTPIFWNIEMIPERYHFWIKLNPVYYIVQGYRDSIINCIWFWQHPFLTVYFWTVTCICFVVGALVFRALKPQFADCL